jgi:hypothetical protein
MTKYLLDVNALIAFGVFDHAFHTRMIRWVKSQNSTEAISDISHDVIVQQLKNLVRA